LLIPCSQELVGSNPTPRANLGGLYANVKRVKNTASLRPKDLSGLHDVETAEQKKGNIAIINTIDSITKSCTKPYFNSILKELAQRNIDNAKVICDYIISEETELNIKKSTKETKIKVLVWLSNHHDNRINFLQMQKQDILQFLNSLRKPTTMDPIQRWVGSYNNRQIILNKFFRWLHNPDEPNHSLRKTPPYMT
jgi:hypothetical protein